MKKPTIKKLIMKNYTNCLKNLPVKHSFFSLKLAFAGVLLLTACQQEPDAPAAGAAATVDVAKVTALEALGHKFGFAEAEFQQYEHGMHELNAGELDLFNDLEAKRFLATPNLPEGEKEGIVRMVALKKELNRRTLKDFNKPYNQVEGSKVVPIMEALYGKSMTETAGGKVAACQFIRKFPSSSGVGTALKVDCITWVSVQQQGQTDCDYQFNFFEAQINGWTAVIAKTIKARQLLVNSKFFPPLGECRGFEGSVSRRRSGDVLNSAGTDYTGTGYCLLLGKARVDWCYNNSPSTLRVELGMGF
jgi:hypothetical protein